MPGHRECAGPGQEGASMGATPRVSSIVVALVSVRAWQLIEVEGTEMQGKRRPESSPQALAGGEIMADDGGSSGFMDVFDDPSDMVSDSRPRPLLALWLYRHLRHHRQPSTLPIESAPSYDGVVRDRPVCATDQLRLVAR